MIYVYILLAVIILLLLIILVSLSIFSGIFYNNSRSKNVGLDITQNGSYVIIDGKPVVINPKPIDNTPRPKPDLLTLEQMNDIYKNCPINDMFIAVDFPNNVKNNLERFIKNVKFTKLSGLPKDITFYNFDYVTNRMIIEIDNNLYCGNINLSGTRMGTNNELILSVYVNQFLGQDDETPFVLTLNSPGYTSGKIMINSELSNIEANLL